MTDELLYCVKADLDGEGGYVDVYITFTKDTLCILRGYEEYGKMKRGQKRKNLVNFTVSGYDEYPIDSILTTSGFFGVVIDIKDEIVIVEFGSNKNCRIPMKKDNIVEIDKQTED